MCGIAGIVQFSRDARVEPATLRRMCDAMVHRGPDDDGIYTRGPVGLGMRRLSIVDLATGHQPITNEDESLWIVFNGEIYNHSDVRKKLEARGHRYRTHSDTETIVHLYEEYGEDCFRRLRGMFAIALWDSRQRKLLLARDRVGKKPVFYAATKKRIVFGSELKCILAAGDFPREIDREAVSDYFSFGYIPAPKTIYGAAKKLRPGHYLVASAEGIRETPYWDISFAEVEQHSEEAWCEQLRHELCTATRVRLMSDVPLGAFLSGGVDSSSVVAMMSHLMKRAVTTCSIGFEEEEFNEAAYARELAQYFHTDHHEEFIRPSAVEILDKLVWHFDEPFADSSAIPTYYVSAVARRHVTVALGGDGGDESFAGYRRYYYDQLENHMRGYLPLPVRRGIFGPLGRAYPAMPRAPRFLRAKATLQSLARSPLEGYFHEVSLFREDLKSRLFTGDFERGLNGYNSRDVLQHYYDRAQTDDLLSRIQYVDIKTYLPDDILAKVDRASMAVSLEVRAPLLDHVLMELAAKIPSSLKLRGRDGKYIFKKAVESVLPKGVTTRKKQGFAVNCARPRKTPFSRVPMTTAFSTATRSAKSGTNISAASTTARRSSGPF